MEQKHEPNRRDWTREPRPPRMGRPPSWMITVPLVMAIASWIPLVVAARARVGTSTEPRIALIQDMAKQPKYRPQMSSDVFVDGRSMRPRLEGTIARGHLDEDDHYNRGYVRTQNTGSGKSEITFFDGFPETVKVTPELLARGQQRFNIYCSVCHGLGGYGNGAISDRALELANVGQATWIKAANLHDDIVRNRPNGHIFNTITNGIRTMGPYGPQIPAADRWAIVAYIRALQLSQNAPADMMPQEKLEALR